MPQYRRADIPGATYFFTVVTSRRQALLTDPRCRESLRNAINAVRWSLIKQHVTRDCAAWLPRQGFSASRDKRGEGSLWQRRFWEHRIRYVKEGAYQEDWGGMVETNDGKDFGE